MDDGNAVEKAIKWTRLDIRRMDQLFRVTTHVALSTGVEAGKSISQRMMLDVLRK